MIRIPFEQPADKKWKCKVCGELMTVRYHWVFDRWLHPTIHERCVEAHDRSRAAAQSSLHVLERAMPARFAVFDPQKTNADALRAAQDFTPDSKVKTLAIIGVPHRGKSRLMWAVVTQFFDILREQTGAKRWPEYYLFADIISELDRTMLNRFKLAKYAFLDDVGSVESYGRERAALQQVIRARVQKGDNWTFMTIDSLKFDDGLEDLLRGRALTIWIDK
jgi:DNA replication protein DnaC